MTQTNHVPTGNAVPQQQLSDKIAELSGIVHATNSATRDSLLSHWLHEFAELHQQSDTSLTKQDAHKLYTLLTPERNRTSKETLIHKELDSTVQWLKNCVAIASDDPFAKPYYALSTSLNELRDPNAGIFTTNGTLNPPELPTGLFNAGTTEVITSEKQQNLANGKGR